MSHIARCFLSLCSLTVLSTPLLFAETPPVIEPVIEKEINVPHQVTPSFAQLVQNVKPALEWNAKSVEEHQEWQKNARSVLQGLLGRMPERVPLDVKWAEEKSFEKFTRYKIYVQTEAEYWAPVYYFVPHELKTPAPAIICLHGHSGIYPYIREGETEADRKKGSEHELDYAPYLAEHGYVTAAIVVRGWNETAGFQDGGVKLPRSCTQMTMNSFLIGMTPQGLRCWDASRVIDFLQSRKEVDASKIGVAGLSGGGTLALYMPLLDDRVKLTMIGGAFSSYKASIYSIRHCVCNCLPGIMEQADMSDVVAAYAPVPVLLINGIDDPIFPIAEAQEGYEKLQQVYRVAGYPDGIDADFFEGGHQWSHRKTVPFLKKHFGTAGGTAEK